MSAPWTPQEEAQLAEYIVQRICSRASGRAQDECLRNYPRDVYFIGSIRPYDPAIPALANAELMNKLAPVAFGVEFRVVPSGEMFEVFVRLRWTCYYRLFPTFDQQRGHQPVSTSSPQRTAPAAGRRRAPQQDSLFLRFQKIECTAEAPIAIRLLPTQSQSTRQGSWPLSPAECARATRTVQADSRRIRTDAGVDKNVRVPQASLQSETSFLAFLQSLTTEVVPQWQWNIQARLRAGLGNQDYVLSIEFVNQSPINPNQENPNVESFLVRSGCALSASRNALSNPSNLNWHRVVFDMIAIYGATGFTARL